MGRSEMLTGGRRKTALLGDAMEAVIAAVYLDAGLEAARGLILRLWGPRIAAARGAGARRQDRAAGMGAGAGAAAARLSDLDRRGARPRAALLGRGAARGRPRGRWRGRPPSAPPSRRPPRRCCQLEGTA